MTPAQPPLADLFARYLNQQSSAHAEGLGLADAEGEVVPYDAVPVQPVEPRLAWSEALAVLVPLGIDAGGRLPAAPPEWPALVASHEPEVALPFALGNYPQLVRHLPALLQASDARARSAPVHSVAPALLDWARVQSATRQPLATLLAVGVLRLAREYDVAEELLRDVRPTLPKAWLSVAANEAAALAWQRGQTEQADALWAAQAESVPILFNRGVASLFLGRTDAARTFLTRATAELPEVGAWHHLGRLYLALAEMRR